MHLMKHVKLNIHNQISHHKGALVNSMLFRNLAITFITECYTRTHMGNPVTVWTNFWCLFSTYRQPRWPHVLKLSRRQNSIKSFPADSRVSWFKHASTQQTASIVRFIVSEPWWWRRCLKHCYHYQQQKVLLNQSPCHHVPTISSDCVRRERTKVTSCDDYAIQLSDRSTFG